MKLLKNSAEQKIAHCNNTKDKLKAIMLIQIKAIVKYESVLSTIFSQIYGIEPRNKLCQAEVEKYIKTIKNVIDEGIEKGEINKCNSRFIAYTIFSLTSSIMIYKKQTGKNYSIAEIYKECEMSIFGEI